MNEHEANTVISIVIGVAIVGLALMMTDCTKNYNSERNLIELMNSPNGKTIIESRTQ